MSDNFNNDKHFNVSHSQSGAAVDMPQKMPQKMPLGRKVLTAIISLFIIFALVIIANLIVQMKAEPESKKKPFNTLAVMASPAKIETVTLSVDVQGETRPRTQINLVPQVGGKIVYVSPNFIEGGIFKKGEALVRIEDADYQVSVVRAQAAVAQAEQAVIRERAEGEIARRDYEELGTGTASPLALRLPQLAQAQASLDAANAELSSAKLQLTRTSVRAPFSGRVRVKSSDVGQFVGPGAMLGTIFSTDITEVRLPLSDTDLTKLNLPIAFVTKSRKVAPKVTFSATIAGQKREWQGRIMRTDSTYDTATRALFAIAEVVDPYGSGAADGGFPLSPGLFVDAHISGKTFEDVLVIARDGLRPENAVFVVDDKGKITVKTAQVIDTNMEHAVLSGGISEGDLVVVSPLDNSQLSMTLKVLDASSPTTILVDPPKPDWLIAREKKETEGSSDKKEKPRNLGRKDKKTLISMLTADYLAVIDNMTEAEKNTYRKMSKREKQRFLKAKLALRLSAAHKSKPEAAALVNGEEQ
ncbi:MAG: efflux RND transporter periplasmic adaptor subunit [Robiginitomaculum sp.]